MELALLVYGISVLSAINGLLLFVCFCVAVVIFARIISYDHNRHAYKKIHGKLRQK